jgi:phage terminase large subunit
VDEPLWFPPGFDWRRPDYAPVYQERIRRLTHIRANLGELHALKEFYKAHPAHWIHDFGFTVDPRQAEIGLPTVMPFLLFPKQQEFIDTLFLWWKNRQDGLVEKSRDMGVSWLCVAFGVWMWSFYDGTVIGFGSRKEEYVDKIGDPKSLFWKIRSFVDFLPPEFQPRGWNAKVHAPHMRVLNPANDAAIVGEAGDNIGRGNRTSIYFVDEAAHLEHDQAVDAALSQTTNCRIDVSTPNGAGNSFYRKRHGGRVKVFVFDWKDDPRKGKDWYAKQVETKDPVVVAQEIDRDYEGSVGDSFFAGPLVTAAMMRGPLDVMPHGGLRVGVDVARFGEDKTVITLRRGRVCIRQELRGKLDIVQVAGFVRETVRAFKESPLEQIAVDTIGLGAGVADILRSDGYFPDLTVGVTRFGQQVKRTVVDVNSAIRLDDGANYNLRAFMARQTKEWLESASIPNDPELKADLTALKYSFRGGLLLMESKDDMKKRLGRSPDRYDSLALTFAVPTRHEEPPPSVTPWRPAVAGVGM